MLNRIIIGRVRAVPGVKRQRADAEAARLKQKEDERLRQEESRLAEAALRWREEEGGRALQRLAEVWRRHRELAELPEYLLLAASGPRRATGTGGCSACRPRC